MDRKIRKLNLRRKSNALTQSTHDANEELDKKSLTGSQAKRDSKSLVNENESKIEELEKQRRDLKLENRGLSQMLDNLNCRLFSLSQLIQSVNSDLYFDREDVIQVPFENPILDEKKKVRHVLFHASRFKYSSCSICLDEFVCEKVALLDCKHIFHIGCLDKWLHENNCCPNCKQ